MPPPTEGQATLRSGPQRQDEVPFSLDASGKPIRAEAPTAQDREVFVRVVIDGRSRDVPVAVPQLDFLGNPRFGPGGEPLVRATTIYDAARLMFPEDIHERIPVLCHQEHIDPVAVCRMCSVQVLEIAPGRPARGDAPAQSSPGPKPRRSLAPACQHRVPEKKGSVMWVITGRYDGSGEWPIPEDCGDKARAVYEREIANLTDYKATVDTSVSLLTRLLSTDHLRDDPSRGGRCLNELAALSDGTKLSVGPTATRNAPLHERSRRVELPTVDYSSRTIEVDHDRCILCDRCVRGCTDVKGFNVIGHTGKGYKTRIAFDLDRAMADSTCVQCGECATVCPTGALTFRRRVAPTAWTDPERTTAPDPKLVVGKDFATPLPEGLLDAESIRKLEFPEVSDADGRPYRPFADVPYPYLKWNEGAVRRRKMRRDEWLCREGEYGSTAFLIEAGSFLMYRDPKQGEARGGWWPFGRSASAPVPTTIRRNSADFILGEMACLSAETRTLSVRSEGEAVVYEVTRNLLDMMRRTRHGRFVLEQIHRDRAIQDCLDNGKLFSALEVGDKRAGLSAALATGSKIERFEPGQRIIAEGALADAFYIIRLGFVQVSRRAEGRELNLDRMTKGDNVGEIALLHPHWSGLAGAEPFRDRFRQRRRTASVTALDHVEVLRVPAESFLGFFELPENADLLGRAAARCLEMLREDDRRVSLGDHLKAETTRLGLYQGQKLLVLDLERCTRCDECTRGCADSHGDGYSRLLREGLRFDRFLVAASCRSCRKPYCLEGCPVDAIHRKGKHLEVVIDSHCIGCGLCEKGCPYGAIQMTIPGDRAVARKAINCDLCGDLVPRGSDPFCVRACPHEAAFRFDEKALMAAVGRKP